MSQGIILTAYCACSARFSASHIYRCEFLETSPSSFAQSASQCELEAIKCPVRSSTSESQVLFSLLAPPQQGFLTSEIGFNERSSSHVEHSTVLVENPSSSPPLCPPTSESWPEYRSLWAPLSCRGPKVISPEVVGRFSRRWPPPCLLNFVTPPM